MGSDRREDPGKLTSREFEVAKIIAEQGVGSYAIAKSLGISISTVRSHLRMIAAKLPGPGGPREKVVRWYYRVD